MLSPNYRLRFTAIFVVVIFFVIASCSGKQDKQEFYLEEIMNDWVSENKKTNVSLIFVVPNAGCPGCIEESLLYLRYNFHKFENAYVIFINVKDRKLLEIQVGKELIQNKNVVFEAFQSNLSIAYKEITSYIFLFNGDKIVEAEPFSLELANRFETVKSEN